MKWFIIGTVVLLVWTLFSFWAFSNSLPNVYSLVWWEKLIYGPVLIISEVAVLFTSIWFFFSKDKELAPWSHKQAQPFKREDI
jgi:hypothetical protein